MYLIKRHTNLFGLGIQLRKLYPQINPSKVLEVCELAHSWNNKACNIDDWWLTQLNGVKPTEIGYSVSTDLLRKYLDFCSTTRKGSAKFREDWIDGSSDFSDEEITEMLDDDIATISSILQDCDCDGNLPYEMYYSH